ncbi:MAG: transposase [Oligoflexia bacterium]|nr:transposase [Oligoflexia bacterium]
MSKIQWMLSINWYDRNCSNRENTESFCFIKIFATDPAGLEKLCRYVGRPVLTNSRISEDGSGNVIYKLRSPYTDGTTEEFIEKLVALIPPSRVHLIRFHGLLAPNCKNRDRIVPSKQGGTKKDKEKKETDIADHPKNKSEPLYSEIISPLRVSFPHNKSPYPPLNTP